MEQIENEFADIMDDDSQESASRDNDQISNRRNSLGKIPTPVMGKAVEMNAEFNSDSESEEKPQKDNSYRGQYTYYDKITDEEMHVIDGDKGLWTVEELEAYRNG